MNHEPECPAIEEWFDPEQNILWPAVCHCDIIRTAYQRGRKDEKAVWMNPCLECGMNSWSTYVCEDCAAARGGEQ